MEKSLDNTTSESKATMRVPLPVPPSISLTDDSTPSSAETTVTTTQRELAISAKLTSNTSAQIFSHHGQPYTYEQYPVNRYDNQWLCSDLESSYPALPAIDNGAHSCSGFDHDMRPERNIPSATFSARRPTSSSVDLWRCQAGLHSGYCKWTGPTGCYPYWNVHEFHLLIVVKGARRGMGGGGLI